MSAFDGVAGVLKEVYQRQEFTSEKLDEMRKHHAEAMERVIEAARVLASYMDGPAAIGPCQQCGAYDDEGHPEDCVSWLLRAALAAYDEATK